MIAPELQTLTSRRALDDPRISSVRAESLRTGANVSPRILVSGTVLGLGGIRTHLILLLQLLRRQGVEVSVFATGSHWDRETLSRLAARGVDFRLPPQAVRRLPGLAAAYSALTWPLNVPKAAQSVYCIGAGRSHFLLNRLKPVGAISVNHEIVVPPAENSPAGECARRLDATVANSLKVAEVMRQFWPDKPIRVIPFLTSDRPMPAPTRTAGAQAPLRVTYLGRLVEQKRPDELVRRWRDITRHPALSGAALNIFGYDPTGRMLDEMQRFVSETGLSGRVRLRGEYGTEQLPGILAETDLVVLPSLWEGLPLVLVEAMTRGVPFVATAAGGTEELAAGNPDVCVTATEWADFETGMVRMAEKIRSGNINSQRLHAWAEARYGHAAVSEKWLRCLLDPRRFFDLHG